MAYILKLSDHVLLIKFSLTLWPGHCIVPAVCVLAQPTPRARVSRGPTTILVIAALLTLLGKGLSDLCRARHMIFFIKLVIW